MTNINLTNHFNTFCCKENLKHIREFIKSNLSRKNINDPDQHLIILAVDEICSNSIIHGNKENPNYCVNISMKYFPGEVVIEIVDEGIVFDYSQYKEPSIENLIYKKEKGSMGLMLVKKIMDTIEFQSINGTNICRLIKRLPLLSTN